MTADRARVKTFVEFRSSKFPPYAGEEHELNPGVWGKRLAEHLVARLADHGLRASAPIAEDWGWYVPVVVDGVQLALCCGHQDGDDDGFLVFTDPSRPIERRWFRRIDRTRELAQLTAALDAILRSDPDVRAIAWRDA